MRRELGQRLDAAVRRHAEELSLARAEASSERTRADQLQANAGRLTSALAAATESKRLEIDGLKASHRTALGAVTARLRSDHEAEVAAMRQTHSRDLAAIHTEVGALQAKIAKLGKSGAAEPASGELAENVDRLLAGMRAQLRAQAKPSGGRERPGLLQRARSLPFSPIINGVTTPRGGRAPRGTASGQQWSVEAVLALHAALLGEKHPYTQEIEGCLIE